MRAFIGSKPLGLMIALVVLRATAVTVTSSVATPDARNGRIAFSSYRGGQLDIFTMGPNGGSVRNLTNDDHPYFQPAWSPRGDRIAYVSLDLSVSNLDQIFTIDPSGGDRTQLTAFDDGNPQEPAWSPDGERIAFHVVFGGAIDNEIYVMNADGTDVQQITDNTSEDSGPAWSPDGTRIAFSGGGRIQTMDPDGSDVSALTPEELLAFDPAWSPNGRRIAFVMGDPGAVQDDLFTVRPDGSHLRRLAATTRTEADPAWSPDGQWIVFVLTHYHEEADTQDDLIVKFRRNGADRTRLSEGSTTRDGAPDWRVRLA